MKVGIITFQYAWNCGAVLQCYALQRKLEKMGHNVSIINYVPRYKEWKYVKYQNPVIVAIETYKQEKHLQRLNRVKKSIKSAGRSVLNYSPKSGRMKMREDFCFFAEKNLKLTKKYSSADEIRRGELFDIYIAGSDQLWNPDLTDGIIESAYYLDFADGNAVKATYAMSACELDLKKYGKQVERLCSSIDYISLRERELQKQLSELLNKYFFI